MRVGTKRSSAWALLVGLAIAVTASAWHHDHVPALMGPSPDPETMLVGSAAKASPATDDCPVCFSHRLLKHARGESPREMPAAVREALTIPDPAGSPDAHLVHTRSARAPPLG